FVFIFQAADGIRDFHVTGVQTCALPISYEAARAAVAGFVGVAPGELVWTKNATEAINLVAYAFSNATAGRGGDAARRFRLGPGEIGRASRRGRVGGASGVLTM